MQHSMSKFAQASLVAVTLFVALHGVAFAGVILQPTSVSTTAIPTAFGIGNTIDQSGLTANYVSGVTDFDTFVATTGHINNNPDLWKTFANPALPIVNTFDLGALFEIGGFAMWHTFPNFHIKDFELFSDTDGNFGNGGTTSLGTFVAPVSGGPGHSFAFNSTLTQFVHLEITSKASGSDITEGEFAFNQVPEPSTLILFALGFCGILGLSYRQRKKAA